MIKALFIVFAIVSTLTVHFAASRSLGSDSDLFNPDKMIKICPGTLRTTIGGQYKFDCKAGDPLPSGYRVIDNFQRIFICATTIRFLDDHKPYNCESDPTTPRDSLGGEIKFFFAESGILQHYSNRFGSSSAFSRTKAPCYDGKTFKIKDGSATILAASSINDVFIERCLPTGYSDLSWADTGAVKFDSDKFNLLIGKAKIGDDHESLKIPLSLTVDDNKFEQKKILYFWGVAQSGTLFEEHKCDAKEPKYDCYWRSLFVLGVNLPSGQIASLKRMELPDYKNVTSVKLIDQASDGNGIIAQINYRFTSQIYKFDTRGIVSKISWSAINLSYLLNQAKAQMPGPQVIPRIQSALYFTATPTICSRSPIRPTVYRPSGVNFVDIDRGEAMKMGLQATRMAEYDYTYGLKNFSSKKVRAKGGPFGGNNLSDTFDSLREKYPERSLHCTFAQANLIFEKRRAQASESYLHYPHVGGEMSNLRKHDNECFARIESEFRRINKSEVCERP